MSRKCALIHLYLLVPGLSVTWVCWSQFQLSLGKDRVATGTSHQLIIGPHRDKQPFTLGELKVNKSITSKYLSLKPH